ncbi:MAG: hypothetical protein D6767_07450 [Candidatus Hydrogenedentota bacterium]|nr:MAG: hypothetical protein D6767_07450 [Candidatus Hydrogenedentota bacterium]
MSPSLKKAFLLIGISFACLLAAVVLSLKIAYDSQTPPMTHNYYEKGLNYQKYIDMDKRAKKENFQITKEKIDFTNKKLTFVLMYPATRNAQKIQSKIHFDYGNYESKAYSATVLSKHCNQVCTIQYAVSLPARRFYGAKILLVIDNNKRLFKRITMD